MVVTRSQTLSASEAPTLDKHLASHPLPPSARTPSHKRRKVATSPSLASFPTSLHLALPSSSVDAITIPSRSPNHYGLIQERLLSLLPTLPTSPSSPTPAHTLTYILCIQAILWNQTTGRTALPVLRTLLGLAPVPEELLQLSQRRLGERGGCGCEGEGKNAAELAEGAGDSDGKGNESERRGDQQDLLTEILRPIGLYNRRAKTLRSFAETWIRAPPMKGKRYVRRDYPVRGVGRSRVSKGRKGRVMVVVVGEEITGRDMNEDLEADEEAAAASPLPGPQPRPQPQPAAAPTSATPKTHDPKDMNPSFEIAHLPGIGPYALNSWRIFGRDALLHDTQPSDLYSPLPLLSIRQEGQKLPMQTGGAKVVESEGEKEQGGVEDEEEEEEERGYEPEWTRTVPLDKDLRAWLVWRWGMEGWEYDGSSGKRRRRESALGA